MVSITAVKAPFYNGLGFRTKTEFVKFIKDNKLNGRDYSSESELGAAIANLKGEKLLGQTVPQKLTKCETERAQLKEEIFELKYKDLVEDLDEEVPTIPQLLLTWKEPKFTKDKKKVLLNELRDALKKYMSKKNVSFDNFTQVLQYVRKKHPNLKAMSDEFIIKKVYYPIVKKAFDKKGIELIPLKDIRYNVDMKYNRLNDYGIYNKDDLKNYLIKNHPDKLKSDDMSEDVKRVLTIKKSLNL